MNLRKSLAAVLVLVISYFVAFLPGLDWFQRCWWCIFSIGGRICHFLFLHGGGSFLGAYVVCELGAYVVCEVGLCSHCHEKVWTSHQTFVSWRDDHYACSMVHSKIGVWRSSPSTVLRHYFVSQLPILPLRLVAFGRCILAKVNGIFGSIGSWFHLGNWVFWTLKGMTRIFCKFLSCWGTTALLISIFFILISMCFSSITANSLPRPLRDFFF
jgi:hypothetical protein